MPPPRLMLRVLLAVILAGPAAAARLETGRLEAGAPYSVALPAEWNGRLLLLAHGLRDEAEPLHAHLFPDRGLTRALLAEGWVVALTGYRRNGVVVRDAITDLDNLRAHVARTHGRPQRTYLMGDSMGGLIVTRIAEMQPEHYDGAVAVGAALHISDTGGPMTNRRPHRPLLYLSNQSELNGPLAYIEAARDAVVRPVLWLVRRDGHVNVNTAERLAALAALVHWVEQGERPADHRDNTVPPVAVPSRAVFSTDGTAEGRVTFVHPDTGAFELDLQPGDFERLGLRLGDRFILHHGATAHEMRYLDDPENSGVGSVAGPEPDGFVRVFLRGRAAREAVPAEGDTVRIVGRRPGT